MLNNHIRIVARIYDVFGTNFTTRPSRWQWNISPGMANHNDVNVLKEPEVAGGKRVLFYSGDDAAAKKEVRDIMEAAGFFPVDLGTLDVGGPLASLPFGGLSTHNFIKI